MKVRLASIALAGALGKEAKSLVPVLGEMLSETIKAEESEDAKAPAETVGDARMRELLLRSACMVMYREGNSIRLPESAFVVHIEQRLVVTLSSSVHGQKNVVVFFPQRVNGNLITDFSIYMNRIDGIVYQGQVVMDNPKANLALIKLNRLPPGVDALPLANKAPDAGTKIATLTADAVSPQNLTGSLWQLHAGKILGVQPIKAGPVDGYFVVIDGVLSEYDSGYPIMDEQGKAVGVGFGAPQTIDQDGKKMTVSLGVDVREVLTLLREYFTKIGGNFNENATRSSLGNVTQNTFRISIARALAQMGAEASDGIPALKKALKDDSKLVRGQVALALGTVAAAVTAASGANPPQEVKTMVQAVITDMLTAATLEDNADSVEQGIAMIGKEAVQPLIKGLSSPTVKIKIAAMRALGRIGPPAKPAEQRLGFFSNTSNPQNTPEMVKAATEALEKIKR
jgi:hypothetical protein